MDDILPAGPGVLLEIYQHTGNPRNKKSALKTCVIMCHLKQRMAE